MYIAFSQRATIILCSRRICLAMIEAIPPTKCHLIVSKSKLKKINKENASLLLKETVQIYLLIKERYLYEYLEIVFRNKYKYIDIKKIFIYKESFLYITLLI